MGLFDNYLEDSEINKDSEFFGVSNSGSKKKLQTNDKDEEEYISLQDKKLEQEIRKLKINNEKEVNNLVLKTMVHAILAEVGHSIRQNFIDLARREAPNLAATLGIPGRERDLEKELSELIGSGLDNFKLTIEKLSKDGIFE